jgi:hypothetical protein
MSVPENMHDAADGRAGPSAEAALREAERASQAPEKIAQVAPGLLEEDFRSVISALQLLGPEMVLDVIRRRKGAETSGDLVYAADTVNVPPCRVSVDSINLPLFSGADVHYMSRAVTLESDASAGGRSEEIQTMKRSSSPYTFGAHVREPLWQTSAYQDASVLTDDCCSPPEHSGRMAMSASRPCGAVCGQTETARSRCEADYSKAATHEQKRPRNASLGKAKITPTVLEPEFNGSAADPGLDGGSVRRLSLCVFAVLVPLLLFFMQQPFSFTNAWSAMRVVLPRQVAQSIDERENSIMRVVLPNAMIVLEPRKAAPAIDDCPNGTSAAAHDAPDTGAGEARWPTRGDDLCESSPAMAAGAADSERGGERANLLGLILHNGGLRASPSKQTCPSSGFGKREAYGSRAMLASVKELRLWVGMTVGGGRRLVGGVLQLLRKVVVSNWVLTPLCCLSVLFLDFFVFA